jgi:hypothetical protein
MTTIRNIQPLDYNEILLPWFAGYDWSPIPKELITKNSFFLIREDKPLVFCSYYTTDVKFAMLGHTIANPYLKVDSKDIENMLSYTLNHAKEAGFTYVHYSTGRSGIGIVNKLKKLGMSVLSNEGYIMGMSLENKDISFLEE